MDESKVIMLNKTLDSPHTHHTLYEVLQNANAHTQLKPMGDYLGMGTGQEAPHLTVVKGFRCAHTVLTRVHLK